MDVTVIVVGLKHSGNLGAIARTCDNFDVDKLILVSPLCEVDDRAYERANRARRYLDNIIIVDSLVATRKFADVLIALSARISGKKSFSRSAISITLVTKQINDMQGNIALVLGREDTGLTNEEVAQCDFLTHIPLPGQNPVLNVAHATTIALWEIFKRIDVSVEGHHQLMVFEERQAFFNYLDLILPHTWIDQDKFSSIALVFSSVLGRALITQREARALIGTLRGIYRSLEENHPPWDHCDVK